ncbi:alpha/beta hydrolase [Nostoc sp. NIES-2111]
MTGSAEFIHRFIPATVEGTRPLLLLHGTGGDENDLLPLGAEIAPGAALLSPRGKVLEGTMPRFFRRLREGIFDIEDLRFRAGELAAFVRDSQARYGIAAPIAVGYSNGANIAAATLLLHPGTLSGAVLLRAMVPLKPEAKPDLASTPVLIVSGAKDPIVPASSAAELAAMLREGGAAVTHEILHTGHGLTGQDVVLARAAVAGMTSAS